MVLWIILATLIILGSTGFIVFSLYNQVNARKLVLQENIQILESELSEKKKILTELAETSLGLVSTDVCDQLRADLEKDEEGLRTEKGRVTIIQAEIEAVDLRLRELEEIEKELENSSLEASRELELLRARERDLEVQNEKLRSQIESCCIQLDKLLGELASSSEAVNTLNAAKSQMLDTQNQIQIYEAQIATMNRKYMDLKRAYDALDIEYAQLYEKQSQG